MIGASVLLLVPLVLIGLLVLTAFLAVPCFLAGYRKTTVFLVAGAAGLCLLFAALVTVRAVSFQRTMVDWEEPVYFEPGSESVTFTTDGGRQIVRVPAARPTPPRAPEPPRMFAGSSQRTGVMEPQDTAVAVDASADSSIPAETSGAPSHSHETPQAELAGEPLFPADAAPDPAAIGQNDAEVTGATDMLAAQEMLASAVPDPSSDAADAAQNLDTQNSDAQNPEVPVTEPLQATTSLAADHAETAAPVSAPASGTATAGTAATKSAATGTGTGDPLAPPDWIGHSEPVRAAVSAPDWTITPPDQIAGYPAEVLVSDPFDNRFDCDRDMRRRMERVLQQYAQQYQEQAGLPVGVSAVVTDKLIELASRDKHYAFRDTSVGKMTECYQLLVVDDRVQGEMLIGVEQAIVRERLAGVGAVSGGAIALVASLFGFLRLLAWRSTDPLEMDPHGA